MLPPSRAGVGSAVNDATRELGGTLGVAVVGSLFSSLYGARLVELLDGRLPAEQLRAAEESVGAADAIGGQVAGVTAAMEDAFMAGLGTASLVIGLLCLAGAVFCRGRPARQPLRAPGRPGDSEDQELAITNLGG